MAQVCLKPILIFCLLACFYKPASGQSLGFPTAEGFGKHTSGGRGGKVYTVTNLNDSGEGSLRNAIEQKGARIIVFAVDGTIDLKSKLVINNDSITIAGQSAPGDGICLKGYPLYIRANNVIVRYIRSRMGDIHAVEDDAMGAIRVKDLIIDHCSTSWSIDECLSVYNSTNVTVQWCMITHSLSKSVHSKGAHGFGGIWGGCGATFHHNLIAHNSSRNPRFASDGCNPVDFRNNVVYNWGFKSAYGGGRGNKVNFVANYYKPGPATSEEKRAWFLDPAEDSTGSYYLHGNIMDGNASVTADNWKGVGEKNRTRAEQPFPFVTINQDSPSFAYDRVLERAGCSLRRDSYDKRVVEEVRTGTAQGGETYAGGNKGIIDSQNAVGGWPELKQGIYPKDSDGDGIPDEWEKKYGLSPNSAKDGSEYKLSKDYTNVEVYLNALVDNNNDYYLTIKKDVDNSATSKYPQDKISDFANKLKPVGRILESDDYYVWCCAPIYDETGKVHVFYSRWPKKYKMGGWIGRCEIAHAVTDNPEGPYIYLETVLAPRPGYFDATTCHNPHIQYINGTYYLFYMGTSDGSVYSKRIGLAKSKSLYGPWERSDRPILEAGEPGSWDDCNTTNPAFILHPEDEQAWLYYKSWNKKDYQTEKGDIRANRKYGLAIADKIEGPYKRYEGNPVVDFSVHGDNKQVEDAYIYIENGTYKMLMRDMGYFDHSVGLIFESNDGLHWSEPKIAWFGADAYLEQSPAPSHLKRYGRFERPQLLMKNGRPEYLFTATQGGKYETSSGFIFKIEY